MVEVEETTPTKLVGRYAVGPELAAGGMAVVHLGHLVGPGGFSRLVAIKRMHPHLAKDRDFVSMFLDEARVAARIRHTNVVSVLDVLRDGSGVYLVMDYVHGDSLSRLLKTVVERQESIDVEVAVGIAIGVLHGLHAAHSATDESGELLNVVHRDVSPQNILIGVDGVARVVDFGIAKAANRLQTTREGQVKGKLSYMSPEQVVEEPVDLRTDVYATSVLLWEMLTGERLFHQADVGATVAAILAGNPVAPSWKRPEVPKTLDEVVLKGLASDPGERFSSAREMAAALERTDCVASPSTVSAWVEALAEEVLAERARLMEQLERAHPSSDHEGQTESQLTQLDAERSVEVADTPEARRRAVAASIAAVLVLVPVALALALLPTWSRSPTDPSAAAPAVTPTPATSHAGTAMSASASASAQPILVSRSACEDAPCKPTALVKGLVGASALTLHGDTLFFATANAVLSIPTRGGESKKLCKAPLGAYALAVHQKTVYFAGARALWSVPTAGGEASKIATTGGTSLGAGADEDAAYFSSTDQVLRLQSPDSKPEVVAESQPGAFAISTWAEHVYWTRLKKKGSVARAPRRGGKAQTLMDGLDHPAGIAVDQDGLYVTEQNAGRVHRIPLAGGSPTVLAEDQKSPSGIAVSEGWVYFTNQNAGEIMKVPCPGGAVTAIATQQSYPTAIAADEKGVYWVNSGRGAVMKVSK